MLPTLAELLTLAAFSGAEVLSGHARLAQPVTWVHVSEVLDAARFLSGGELLLSTGSLLAQASAQGQADFVRSLAEGGAQGLVLELVAGVPGRAGRGAGGRAAVRVSAGGVPAGGELRAADAGGARADPERAGRGA